MLLFTMLMACGGNEKSPEQIYVDYCGICHGDNGEGYVAPQANALFNPEFLAAATDEFLKEGTIHGRPGTKMSPWGTIHGGPLSDDTTDDLVAYMRMQETLPTADIHNMQIEGNATQAMEVYDVYCATCHGAEGEGDSAMSINNPEFLRTASDGFIWHAIQVGRSGTPMGSYAETLTENQINDLVALIRSWEPQ